MGDSKVGSEPVGVSSLYSKLGNSVIFSGKGRAGKASKQFSGGGMSGTLCDL